MKTTYMLYNGLLLALLASLIALPYVEVPISISARGKIQPAAAGGPPDASIGPLLAECRVPPAVVGYLRRGQPVRLQVDGYPHQQWGMLEALVVDIDRAVQMDEATAEAYFVVRCQLQQDMLALPNGYQAKIGQGSTYTASFHLLDRSLWQLLFDRAEDWFNPQLIANHEH